MLHVILARTSSAPSRYVAQNESGWSARVWCVCVCECVCCSYPRMQAVMISSTVCVVLATACLDVAVRHICAYGRGYFMNCVAVLCPAGVGLGWQQFQAVVHLWRVRLLLNASHQPGVHISGCSCCSNPTLGDTAFFERGRPAIILDHWFPTLL